MADTAHERPHAPSTTASPKTRALSPTAPPLLPSSINWSCILGVGYEYVADDAALLAAGILTPEELPGPRLGCRKHLDGITSSRLKDGRVKVVADADPLLARDHHFKHFLGGLLADVRLSLVQGESSR